MKTSEELEQSYRKFVSILTNESSEKDVHKDSKIHSDATFITIGDTTYKVRDHVVFGINIGTEEEIILKEGYVAFGEFDAEIFTCYGFFVADKYGNQVSEAGLTEDYVKR